MILVGPIGVRLISMRVIASESSSEAIHASSGGANA